MVEESIINLEHIFRTGHVDRWQIVRTLRQQTLAEHSYMVAMLSSKIIRHTIPNHSDRLMSLTYQWALLHDIPEVKTGDLATPVKDMADFSDFGVFEEYDELVNIISNEFPIIFSIVKVADLIEAYNFLLNEQNSNHGKRVCDGIETKIRVKINQCKELYLENNWEYLESIYHKIKFNEGV